VNPVLEQPMQGVVIRAAGRLKDRFASASWWGRACAFVANTTLVFGATAAHAEKPVVTLDQVVALALQHNPSLHAEELAVASARVGEITARLRPNPILGNETADLTAMITQLVELGGKRARRMDSARLATEVAHSDLADARRTLLLSVRATFAAGLLAQSNLARAQENFGNFRRVEELSRLRLEAGDIARSELLKVQLQELQFAGDVQDAALALATAKAALRALVSSPDLPEDFDLETSPPLRDGRGEVATGTLMGYLAVGGANDEEGALGICSALDHAFMLRVR